VKLRPGQTIQRDALEALIDAAYDDVIARLDRLEEDLSATFLGSTAR
jgi:hypothetical protein